MLLIRSSSGLRLVVALVLAAALLASLAAPSASAQTDQATEQEGESGDADQSGTVSAPGDNSNQCVGVQPVSNTGNAQNAIDIIIQTPAGDQYTKRVFIEDLDIDLEDIESSINIAPELTVECAQEVEQAATAAAADDSGSCSWVWDNGWWCQWSTDGSWWAWDDGSYTSWSGSYWYESEGGWWYWDSDGWWWWDGYEWSYHGWNTVSNVATGALDAAKGGTMQLAMLGSVALLGTAGVLLRRNRGRG